MFKVASAKIVQGSQFTGINQIIAECCKSSKQSMQVCCSETIFVIEPFAKPIH